MKMHLNNPIIKILAIITGVILIWQVYKKSKDLTATANDVFKDIGTSISETYADLSKNNVNFPQLTHEQETICINSATKIRDSVENFFPQPKQIHDAIQSLNNDSILIRYTKSYYLNHYHYDCVKQINSCKFFLWGSDSIFKNA